MNITITLKTEFNIGDKVYVANCYHEFYPSSQSHTIKDIWVDINAQRTQIRYIVECNGVSECVSEDYLFDTYDKCAQWCKEHS